MCIKSADDDQGKRPTCVSLFRQQNLNFNRSFSLISAMRRRNRHRVARWRTTHHSEDSAGLSEHVLDVRTRDVRVLFLRHSHEVIHLLARRRTVGGFVIRSQELVDDRFSGAVRQVERSEETRLNSSHVEISYAVFCLKKKKKKNN